MGRSRTPMSIYLRLEIIFNDETSLEFAIGKANANESLNSIFTIDCEVYAKSLHKNFLYSLDSRSRLDPLSLIGLPASFITGNPKANSKILDFTFPSSKSRIYNDIYHPLVM